MSDPSGHSWEAAFHEAGHCVLAHRSLYHSIEPGLVVLRHDGSGHTFIALDTKKVMAQGLIAHPSAAVVPSVAETFAILLAAGLVAERLASAKGHPVTPDLHRARVDHAMMEKNLVAARLSFDLALYEAYAAGALEDFWPAVEAVACKLQQSGELHSTAIEAIIDRVLSP